MVNIRNISFVVVVRFAVEVVSLDPGSASIYSLIGVTGDIVSVMLLLTTVKRSKTRRVKIKLFVISNEIAIVFMYGVTAPEVYNFLVKDFLVLQY